MDHDLVYVKKHPKPDNPEGVAYVVPAVGIRGKTTDKLIPHPFGNCSAEFSTLQDTIEAVHRAGYALEVDGQLYPLPDQKPVFRSVKPAAGRPATLFDTMVPVLVRMLDDNSPNVVSSAAYALGELNQPRPWSRCSTALPMRTAPCASMSARPWPSSVDRPKGRFVGPWPTRTTWCV
ncbi:MAG: hypothetical protein KC476_07100 [Cyanobacteria bacterium HKST-UBA06]|nr:hypothetical protein [Cyanobacteria bacterium HKST-UBA06]